MVLPFTVGHHGEAARQRHVRARVSHRHDHGAGAAAGHADPLRHRASRVPNLAPGGYWAVSPKNTVT